jgi:hypothetical protein
MSLLVLQNGAQPGTNLEHAWFKTLFARFGVCGGQGIHEMITDGDI